MSSPAELYVEEFVRQILIQNAPIGIIPADRIVVQANDIEALAKKNRITCSAKQTRQVALKSFDGAALKQIWIPLTLTLWTATEVTADEIQTAIEEMLAAMNNTNTPDFSAGSLAAFTAAGIARWESTDEGEFQIEDNGRKRSSVLNFLCNV